MFFVVYPYICSLFADYAYDVLCLLTVSTGTRVSLLRILTYDFNFELEPTKPGGGDAQIDYKEFVKLTDEEVEKEFRAEDGDRKAQFNYEDYQDEDDQRQDATANDEGKCDEAEGEYDARA